MFYNIFSLVLELELVLELVFGILILIHLFNTFHIHGYTEMIHLVSWLLHLFSLGIADP